MGDMELDSMDSFDSYDSSDDYESFDPNTDRESPLDKTDSTVDAVAALLTGDSSKADQMADSGSRGGRFSVRDDDTMSSTRDRAVEETPAYLSNQSAPDTMGTSERIEHYAQTGRNLEGQMQQLKESYSAGDITQQQFEYGQNYIQGQWAAATIQQQQAQLEQYQNQAWLTDQENRVRAQHADVWNDPPKRDHYRRQVVDYLGNEMGFSSDEMENMGAREINQALTHIKTREENQRMRLELAKFKQERRERNKALNQGRRDSEVGARSTKSTSAQQDEIVRLLFGGGK